jgi:hypothetical protein
VTDQAPEAGPAEPGVVPVEPAQPRRRADPLAAVLATLSAGIGLVVAREVRLGLYVVAASLALGAVLRLALRPRMAGSLVVRARHLDVFVLAAAAVAMAVLASVTPFPRA